MFCNTNTLLCQITVAYLKLCPSFCVHCTPLKKTNKQQKKQRCRVQNHVIIRLRKKYIHPISPHVSNDQWWWCNCNTSDTDPPQVRLRRDHVRQRATEMRHLMRDKRSWGQVSSSSRTKLLTPTRPTFLFCHTDLMNFIEYFRHAEQKKPLM